jgi:hypothetical protein
VIGNPKGLEGTFSSGIVAALRGNDEIQIDAPISPGSSGGPVLNDAGLVVGVAASSVVGGQNLNFAVLSRFLQIEGMHGFPAGVDEVGALAISDREYKHFKGPVRSYAETVTQIQPSAQGQPLAGPELTSVIETFDIAGRVVKWEHYRSGAPMDRPFGSTAPMV